MAVHLPGTKRRDVKLSNKVVKDVITGASVPKSFSEIELEKNYVMLAKMFTGMIERMQRIEANMENIERRMSHLILSKKKSSL